ncbi:undecaprenyl-diphosphate phosphatase [Pasteuria penetrans]|uniref:undecaprenyl-diphosphate phosphatase n=1 Tax=Pasteuria penetrans TaxID=86005 RepID=UPI000FC33C1F|nr:undecaprenyl-diphosphate phosphatase [Pasteuria penetrans]
MLGDGGISQLWVGFILGIVEGLTEFIPVSSTGHMILVSEKILHFKGEQAKTFEVVIQIGAGLAVVLAYRNRFFHLARSVWKQSIKTTKDPVSKGDRNLSIGHLIIACLPAALIGLFLHSQIKELFTSRVVAVGVLLGAILMLGAEFPFRKQATSTQSLDAITYSQALWVGLFQCLSLWPGFSRSGSTIAGGLLTGMNHKTAASFSFLVSVPILTGASILDFYKSWDTLHWDDWPLFAAGFITSFVVAIAVINFFLRLLPKTKLWPFVLYRFVLFVVILLFMS